MTDRHKVNVLLVDDQPARLLSYEAILSTLDQNLVTAGSGVEALERLMRDEFAVILLDVSMPGMDGFETAATIHEHPRFERTPIIFVTAHNVTDLDRMKGYALGAVDYVYVPVVPEILRSKVSVLVELHQQRRELERLNSTLAGANSELALANSTLQAEKARELERLNANLGRANAELAHMNATLEGEIAVRKRVEDALRQSEERLREADHRKDEFLAMLAHELRNPLAPILHAVQLMRMKPVEDAELAWCRDVIGRQTEHLRRLVDDLLDVSRITYGKIKLQQEPLEIAVVVGRAIEITRPLIDARHHELVVELPAHPLEIEGDPTRLAQVLGNLLNNAAKYTDEGGRIVLSVEAEPGADGALNAVVIRVRDTGVGISEEVLPRLFELFTQAERTLDRSHGGLGIGLALVRRLVELHGGTVTARSDGAKRGSEFTVRLPALRTRRDRVNAASGENARPSSSSSRRILVVDDNVDAARGLALLLEMEGNTVETAYDGEQAVQLAQKSRPDLVFLDIGMPKLDGYGAARWIRAQPWGRDVTLVALTGLGEENVRKQTHEAGFDAHLVKPVDFREMNKLLDKIHRDARRVG